MATNRSECLLPQEGHSGMKPGLLLIIFILSFALSKAQDMKSGGVLKPEQAIMDIRHYTVSLGVDPTAKTIDGFVEIDFILSQATDKLLFDLTPLLTVRKVWVNRKEQPFAHNGEIITIRLATSLNPGKAHVKIEYGGAPGVAARPPWNGGFTWAKDAKGNPWIDITCQSDGAKIYFPCKDHPSDEPNEGADVIMTVPKGLYVSGPGLLIDQKTRKDKTTFHWQTKYTINNYSILFNIGKFTPTKRIYTTVSGNKVPMFVYLLDEHLNQAEGLLDILERSVRLEEKYFGEYPWIREKMAITESMHPGMEHQTSNTYGANFKYRMVGGKTYDEQVTHEFGHEWWGNKVTGKDWADMWIQEGICTFGDAMYIRDYEGEEAYLKLMQQTARKAENRQPIVPGKNIDTDEVYQRDIYGKGAFFMHTLRYIIGDSIFFPTLKKLATDSKYTYDNLVTTDDVEELFATASGKDLSQLFDLYLRTINKLEISVKQISANQYKVSLLNVEGSLPIEIVSDGQTSKSNINKAGIIVTSNNWPQIDPNVYYLKKVILE